ncbi:MAG: RluA family pseudouridine synthase [Chloroflexota bacterium]
MTERIETFHFDRQQEGRLDHFLVEKLPAFSRSRLQGLVKDGFVKVNGIPARKAGQTLETGMTVDVTIPLSAPTNLVGENIPLDIVFEDDNLLVIDKPAGMVVHPAAGHDTGTLVHAVLGYAPDIEGIGGEERPGVVHRLDKDTSGLILLAKNERAHRWLQDQFRLRKVEKTYLALVDGRPPTPNGRVEAAIGRDPAHRKKMAVMPPGKGREAVSGYTTLETFAEHTLLAFHPLTGRTHQIRLHCAFLGCPIVGDKVYGHRKPSIPLERHFLHAAKLKITLPGEKQARAFEAPLPGELETVLQELRK